MAYTEPPLVLTGDVIPASYGNTYVRGNGRFFKGTDGPIALDSAVDLLEIATPGAPGAGLLRVYAKSGDSRLFVREGASGVETAVGGGDETLLYSLGRSF